MEQKTEQPDLVIDLAKDHYYRIELYPKTEVVLGRYLGDSEDSHIFKLNKSDAYIFVNRHWMEVRGGAITHKEISSFSINCVTQEGINRMPAEEKSRLVKELNQVRVNI